MTDTRAFDDRLRAWLQDGPEEAPPDLIELVLDEVPAVRRSLGFRRGIGWTPRTGRWLIAVAAVVAVAVIGALTLLPRQPSFGPPTSSSPTPSVSPSASVSPLASLPFQPCQPSTILATPGSDTGFDPITVRGRIAYRVARELRAVDPERPQDVIVLDPDFPADPTSWSTDGARLLLLGQSEAFGIDPIGATVLSSDGSRVRFAGWGTGSFAPDGKSIVGAVPGGGLCRASTDGTSNELLAFDMAEPMDGPPAWSPDGAVIAFMDFVEDSAAYGHHAYGMSFIDPDGSNLEQLAVPFGIEEGGGGLGWSADGTRLIYWLPKGGVGDSGQIYVMDVASRQARQLTTDRDNRWPAWSPDSSRIAFVRDDRLYTMAPDGGDIRPVRDIAPFGSIAWNSAR